MHFLVLKENLNKTLSILIRNIATGQQIPILSNILITAKNKELTLTATNMEIGIICTLLTEIKKEGATTIPGKMFSEFINLLPAEKIEFKLDNTKLNVKTKSNKASFSTANPADFPSFPQKVKSDYKLQLKNLREAILRMVFSASTDEGRPVLTGVKLSISNGKIKLLATDGYRLSAEETNTTSLKEDLEVILPAKVLSEIIRISKETNAEEIGLSILKEKNQVCFTLPNILIFTRIIEGEFPNVEKIIPSGFKTRITLDKDKFSHSVKTISLFARGAANIIKIKIEQEGLRLSASTPQTGEGEEFVEAKVEGEESEVAFNYRFLLDLLANFSGDKLIFEASGSLNPGVFRSTSSKSSFLHLIMPVRIQGEE